MTIHSYYFVCVDHVPSSFVLDVVAKFLVVHVGRRSNVLARRKMIIVLSTIGNEIVSLPVHRKHREPISTRVNQLANERQLHIHLSTCRSVNLVSNATLPTLPSACQQLEHSAARDRIAVKNNRRQPVKPKVAANDSPYLYGR